MYFWRPGSGRHPGKCFCLSWVSLTYDYLYDLLSSFDSARRKEEHQRCRAPSWCMPSPLREEQGREKSSQWYTPSPNWSRIFDRKWRSRTGFCGSFKIGGMCEACSAAVWGSECQHLEGHESNATGETFVCKEAPECLWNISLAGVCSVVLSRSS